MNKKVPLWALLLTIWIFVIVAIGFGWAVWHIKSNGPLIKGKTAKIIISIATFPSLVQESFKDIFHSSVLVVPDIYPEINGLKVERNYIDSNYILLPFFDKRVGQSVVKLIRLCDQKTVFEWKPDFDLIKKIKFKESSPWQDIRKTSFDISHPLLSSDGSITFHSLNSPLIKVDKYSKLVWILNGDFNHSLEYDSNGNMWSISLFPQTKFFKNFFKDYKDDAITEVSQSGKIIFQKSISEILLRNGWRGILLGVGPYESDMLHTNDIQPALTSTKYWLKGDLLISLRNKSTVFLYRPSSNKVIWLKTGPWLHQHDVDFIDNKQIGVFGNNTIRTDGDEQVLNGHNEEYIYDFEADSITTPYTEFLRHAKVATTYGGRSDVLPNGDLFIEETDNNRLLRGNKKNILWQYVNRADKHSVAVIQWSRFITKAEFNKLTFLQKN